MKVPDQQAQASFGRSGSALSQPEERSWGDERALAVSARRVQVTAGSFCLDVQELAVRRGRITAILGPNGAGKTTLIEALLGVRPARLTQARLLGMPVPHFLNSPRQRRQLGVQLQRVEYADTLMVSELLNLHHALYARQDTAIAQTLQIEALRRLPCSALSRGQKQRLDLFMALAHRPQLAVLDEPFTGLDRAFIERVGHLLRHELTGMTVLMVCHSLEELDTASEVLWICGGGIEFSGPKDTLKNRLIGAFHVHLQLDDAARLDSLCQQLANDPATLRLQRSYATHLDVYGSPQLQHSISTLICHYPFSQVAFGSTHERDMLHLCAQGRADG